MKILVLDFDFFPQLREERDGLLKSHSLGPTLPTRGQCQLPSGLHHEHIQVFSSIQDKNQTLRMKKGQKFYLW